MKNNTNYFIVIAGVCITVLIWLFEALMDSLLLETNFAYWLMPTSDPVELLDRGLRSIAIILASVFIQGLYSKRRETGEALKRLTDTLEQRIDERTEELKVTIAELSESEERYSLVMEGSNDGIFDWDIRTGDVYWNDRFYEMVGLSRSKVSASLELFTELLHPEDRQRILDAVTEHLERGVEYKEEFRLRHSDGEYRAYLGRGRALRSEDGETLRMAGAMTDITERKRTEQEIQQLNESLESRIAQRTAELKRHAATLQNQAKLLDLSNDAIIVRDLEGKVSFWNRGAEQMYNWSKEEVLGNDAHALLKTRFPRPPEEIRVDILRNGRWEGELVQTKRDGTVDGTVIVTASRWALQRDEHSEPVQILETNNDITERRKFERDLKAYAARLEQSNRELQDFAYVASHDLQEPLRKIQTFGDRLMAKYAETLGEQGRDYLQRMQGAAGRMQNLINELLALSRITTQAQPFVLADLNEVARNVVSDLGPRIEQLGASMEVGNLPTIEADSLQMHQLLQNLIVNALKFHRRAEAPIVKVYGGYLEERKTQSHKYTAGNTTCQIIVEDNGIGFDERHLERIFVPFQRLHGRAAAYEGTGMGLAICRKVVERHSGTITAKSAPGRGAAFIVTLPTKQLS